MTKRFKDAAELGLTEAELATQVALAEEIVDELIAEERARKRFEVETYTAPACWASYLINGDASGRPDGRVCLEAKRYIARNDEASP